FSQPLSGLSPSTTYWFCAIASNTAGPGFGAVLSFTTSTLPPSVTTLSATGVGAASATLQGSADPAGAAAAGWFRWSTSRPASCDDVFGTRAPTNGGTPLSGNGAQPFSQM